MYIPEAERWLSETEEWRAVVHVLSDKPGITQLESLYRLELSVDRATRQLVLDYRCDGRTWAEIGGALGITRQAAQQRFGTHTPPCLADLPPELDGVR